MSDDIVKVKDSEVEIETDEDGSVEKLPPVGEGEPVVTTTVEGDQGDLEADR